MYSSGVYSVTEAASAVSTVASSDVASSISVLSDATVEVAVEEGASSFLPQPASITIAAAATATAISIFLFHFVFSFVFGFQCNPHGICRKEKGEPPDESGSPPAGRYCGLVPVRSLSICNSHNYASTFLLGVHNSTRQLYTNDIVQWDECQSIIYCNEHAAGWV